MALPYTSLYLLKARFSSHNSCPALWSLHGLGYWSLLWMGWFMVLICQKQGTTAGIMARARDSEQGLGSGTLASSLPSTPLPQGQALAPQACPSQASEWGGSLPLHRVSQRWVWDKYQISQFPAVRGRRQDYYLSKGIEAENISRFQEGFESFVECNRVGTWLILDEGSCPVFQHLFSFKGPTFFEKETDKVFTLKCKWFFMCTLHKGFSQKRYK